MRGATVIAVDIGAESGRVHAVSLERGRLRQRHVHRFTTGAVEVGGTLYWNVLAIWDEVRRGIRRARPLAATSVGVDTWGVDFALLDERGRLLGNPVHYRDRRTEGMMEALFERIPRERVFDATGIQIMPINTVYQLLSMVLADDPQLDAAVTFLTMPDLLHYWLSGARACEFTIATTTQLLDPRTQGWSRPILEAVGVEPALFPPVVQPGTRLGSFEGLEVIAPAGHDTACAVVGAPALDDDFAYISSGTWSLVGIETDAPVMGPTALAENVTNEGGVAATTRLLKNVTGLWIVQQCQRAWQEDGVSLGYGDLVREAERAPPLRSLIDPDHPDFLRAGPHPAMIRAHCRATGQPAPGSPGATVRSVLDSLALAYRRALEAVERVSGRSVGRIHVVGGGARNGLLCQATADATGRPVTAGPAEATILGNGAVQLMSVGALTDLAEARRAIARGCRVRRYAPTRGRGAWDAAYERWNALAWPSTWRDHG